MYLAMDVDYKKDGSATIAGIMFESELDKEPRKILISHIEKVEDYESGNFYKRELPCIIKLIEEHNLSNDITYIVDGYVFIDGKSVLGHKLYEYFNKDVEVIGVAKNPYVNISDDFKVSRYNTKPLYITTTGCLNRAKNFIYSLSGEFRIPTLLKLADRVCRDN